MGSFKPILVFGALAGIGYVTFISLNSGPPAEPPPDAPSTWDIPEVELGEMGAPTALPTQSAGLGAEAPFGKPASSAPPATAGLASHSAPPAFGAAPPGGSSEPLSSAPAFGTYGASPTGDAHTHVPAHLASSAPGVPPTSVAPAWSDRASAVGEVSPASMVVSSPVGPVGEDPYAIKNPLGSGVNGFAASNPGMVTTAEPASHPQTSSPAFMAAVESVQKSLDSGRLADAHLELSQWYGSTQVASSDHAEIVQLLDQLAGTVVYSRSHLLEPAYEVKPGESLADIAREYKVPKELLAKINGLDKSAPLAPGEQLKVVRGPFKGFVDLEKRELTMMLQDENGGAGRYAGRFPIEVSSGADIREGSFYVQNKIGDPVWISLGSGLGIYGADGSQNSNPNGIRLSQHDMGDVFDMLSQGSTIVIRR